MARPDLRAAARALRHRNYRLFFTGQLLSQCGTWMQNMAQSWLAYSLTHSAFMLGAVGFCSQIATFVVTPFAGILADRMDRQRILLVTQALAMLQALTLAALTLTHQIQIWHLLALGAALGVINAFDIPTRQSFVGQMLEDPQDLPNAIALNSSLVNGARLLGPVTAGVLVAWVGEGVCFLINGLSYLAVLAALAAIRVAPFERPRSGRSPLGDLREGLSYVAGHRPIRALILLLALVSLMGQPYTTLLPVFATDVFHGNSSALGLLTGATGLGALFGAFFLATRTDLGALPRLLPFANLAMGLGLVAFAQVKALPPGLPILMLVGGGMMLQMAVCNTLVQTMVEERMRGRVMSFYAMAFMGMAPFGNLLAGSVAHRFGAPVAVTVSGLAVCLGGLAFASRLPTLRFLPVPLLRKAAPEAASPEAH